VPAFQRRSGINGGCKTIKDCRDKLSPLSEKVPGRYGQLRRCVEQKECIVFQADNSATSHSTTDSARWLGETEVRPLDCFKSNRYEPFRAARVY